jgi:hypothetical protein
MSNPPLSPTQRSHKPNKPLSVENPLENGGKTPPSGEIVDGLAKLMLFTLAEMEPKRDMLIPVQDLRWRLIRPAEKPLPRPAQLGSTRLRLRGPKGCLAWG